jgi:16S rRNA (cytidine1402-2'-O)-methyltransferase
MQNQNSFKEERASLYLVPTPIGNLEDITFRALRILKEVDWIAAEDTRQTKKLTTHFEIPTPLISYHEHNKHTSGEKIIANIKNGQSVAIVSDAGMPGISDPGYDLVKSCIAENIPVISLPGANAALTTLVASGLPTDHFYFHGFLPRDKKDKRKELEELRTLRFPIIFYESPHRLKDTISLMDEILGERQVSVARELTKKFEEFIRGTLGELKNWVHETDIKGEFCIIVDGSHEEVMPESNWWDNLTIDEHVNYYIDDQDLDSKAAIKQTAKDRGLPKRDVYQAFHIK